MVCKNCGKYVESDSEMCEYCGKDPGVKSESDAAVKTLSITKGTLVMAVIITVIVCVVMFVVIPAAKNKSTSTSADVKDSAPVAYYKDDTVPGTLKTYLYSLMNDDYETYLKITHKSDSEEAKSQFNRCKDGYVGIDSVQYGEVRTNSLYGMGADAEYKVAEYNSDGTQKIDYYYAAGRDYSYGLIVIDKEYYDAQEYYVSLHYTNFNFNYKY